MAKKLNTIGWRLFIGFNIWYMVQSFIEKDNTEAIAWLCCAFYGLLIWFSDTKKEWILTAEMPLVEGEEVIAHHSEWIDEDYNPKGTRIGFLLDGKFVTAVWNNYQDYYNTEDDLMPTHYQIIDPTPKLKITTGSPQKPY
ncbi:hypothetical protein [Runella sp.]|uniref:hypothetical protein n=1 Tax=Runella sp. TaxID=1960881 RepID=UPI003D0D1186